MRRLLLPLLLASTVIAVPLGQAAATRTSSAARTPAPTRVSEDPRDLSKAAPESAGVSSERLKRLDAGLQRFVRRGSARRGHDCPDAAREDRPHDNGRQAERQPARRAPARRHLPHCSMTKPITGVAMMMLFEDGKWRLNDPVSRYIPQFAKLQVYAGENADGTPKLEDARSR